MSAKRRGAKVTVRQPPPESTGGAGIHIGVSRAAVETVYTAIAGILAAAVGDQVKSDALLTMRETCRINNVTISGCHINMGAR